MAKLSGPMSDALSDLASYGVFQSGTRKQTITGLISRGLVIKTGDDDYNITDEGRAELGTTADALTEYVTGNIVDKVTVPGDMSGVPVAEWEAELLGINPDRPYMVQALIHGEWINIGEGARTWGTANVRRNRLSVKIRKNRIVGAKRIQGIRVIDLIDNRICA